MAVNLDGTKRQLRDIAKRKVERAAARMTDDLKRTAPVNTGELRRQTGVEYQGQTDKVTTALAQIGVDYGGYVVHGIRTFTMPRKGTGVYAFAVEGTKVLASGRSVSGMVFTKGPITHPGTQPNQFYENVIRRWPEYLR